MKKKIKKENLSKMWYNVSATKTFNRERTDFQMEELLAIFCDTDDFCKEYEEYCTHHLLVSREEIIPQTRMYLSEIMTIVIYFHLSHYRTFKW